MLQVNSFEGHNITLRQVEWCVNWECIRTAGESSHLTFMIFSLSPYQQDLVLHKVSQDNPSELTLYCIVSYPSIYYYYYYYSFITQTRCTGHSEALSVCQPEEIRKFSSKGGIRVEPQQKSHYGLKGRGHSLCSQISWHSALSFQVVL